MKHDIVTTVRSNVPTVVAVCDVSALAALLVDEVFLPFLTSLTFLDTAPIVDESEHSTRLAAVKKMRGDKATWREIGVVLGTSRQAAWERFHNQVN